MDCFIPRVVAGSGGYHSHAAAGLAGQDARYQQRTLNVVSLTEPRLSAQHHPVSSKTRRKKGRHSPIGEELRSIFMSRFEKKSSHKSKRHSKIRHLLSEKGAKIELINHFTPEQISEYFDSDPTPRGWPAIKAHDKNSVVAGLGNNTKVKMAIKKNRSGSKLVAVKKIYTSEWFCRKTVDSCRRRSLREICLQRRAKSCAPAVYGIAERMDLEKKCHKMYLAMELIKAPRLESIYRFLAREDKLTIACSLAIKLDLLHHKHIYAGDFKDSNVLVDPQDLQVTIIDFGCSCDLRESIELNFDYTGICHYHAPEIYQASRYYCASKGLYTLPLPDPFPGIYKNRLLLPKKADIYSLGIILAKMFSRRAAGRWCLTYREDPLTTIARFNKQVQRTMKLEQLDRDLRPLVAEMLQAEPDRRPDLAQVIKTLETLRPAGSRAK